MRERRGRSCRSSERRSASWVTRSGARWSKIRWTVFAVADDIEVAIEGGDNGDGTCGHRFDWGDAQAFAFLGQAWVAKDVERPVDFREAADAIVNRRFDRDVRPRFGGGTCLVARTLQSVLPHAHGPESPCACAEARTRSVCPPRRAPVYDAAAVRASACARTGKSVPLRELAEAFDISLSTSAFGNTLGTNQGGGATSREI